MTSHIYTHTYIHALSLPLCDKLTNSTLFISLEYFDTQEAFALNLLETYSMVPIHRNDENSNIMLVKEYHKSLAQFSKTIGRELESRLKKTVYRSIEQFLKLFSGPLQVMKKREKKLLDYDNVRGMKERGDTVRFCSLYPGCHL